jgi:hypothetical protein
MKANRTGFVHRLSLWHAVLLSVVLHLTAVVGSEFSWPDFYTPPDEVLNRKQPEKIQRVRLAAQPKPAPIISGPRFIASAPKQPLSATPAPKKKPVEPASAADNEAITPDDPVDTALPEQTPENIAEASSPLPPPPEPAPAFPVQVRADLELRVNSLSTVAEQHWGMEGFRYFISINAKKFGVRAQLESEGEIGADGGLRPHSYRMKVNDKIRSSAEYQNGALTYGKSSFMKTALLAEPPQDMASLPFHVAVTFDGSPQIIKVTTGNNLYEVRLVLDAEETLKLPVGTIRTLHLRGERYNPENGTMIAGYEVWLAPDYLNYPVKFIGRTGKGDAVEYRVRRLEIEGKTVLGDAANHVLTPEGNDIPEWLQQRMKETSSASDATLKPAPVTTP